MDYKRRFHPLEAYDGAAGTISTMIWTGADKPLTPGRVHNTAHERDPPPSLILALALLCGATAPPSPRPPR